MSGPKRIRKIVEIAEQHGWEAAPTNGGHYRMLPPPGATKDGVPLPIVVLPGTPSDSRSDLNTVAMLRRCGLPIPHRGRTPKKAS